MIWIVIRTDLDYICDSVIQITFEKGDWDSVLRFIFGTLWLGLSLGQCLRKVDFTCINNNYSKNEGDDDKSYNKIICKDTNNFLNHNTDTNNIDDAKKYF